MRVILEFFSTHVLNSSSLKFLFEQIPGDPNDSSIFSIVITKITSFEILQSLSIVPLTTTKTHILPGDVIFSVNSSFFVIVISPF